MDRVSLVHGIFYGTVAKSDLSGADLRGVLLDGAHIDSKTVICLPPEYELHDNRIRLKNAGSPQDEPSDLQPPAHSRQQAATT